MALAHKTLNVYNISYMFINNKIIIQHLYEIHPVIRNINFIDIFLTDNNK